MEENNHQQEFLVTARKWRPMSFSSVIGQEHITTTLQNAVKLSRIHHAYLFSGPRGVGKTTTARILARSINCTNPQVDNEPCNQCDSCVSIIEGRSLDVIEIDGASNNSVDDIRKLRENSKYLPSSGKYKIYIIDEVHMLSTSAFNALLKTLEEPPSHLLFIFATTEPNKVLPTILSRCQRFEFKRMEISEIVNSLKKISEKENINIDEKSLITIAKKADGSMRDSQSIFDQVVAFCGNDIKYSDMSDALHLIDTDFYFRITDDLINKDFSDLFILTKQIIDKGYDLKETMEGLVEHFRNILTIKVTGSYDLIEAASEYFEKYKKVADYYSKSDLLRLLVLASNSEYQLKSASQPRIKFETTLLQMASLDSTMQISELIDEIRELKKKSKLESFSSGNNEKASQLVNREFNDRSTNLIKENKFSFSSENISAKDIPKNSIKDNNSDINNNNKAIQNDLNINKLQIDRINNSIDNNKISGLNSVNNNEFEFSNISKQTETKNSSLSELENTIIKLFKAQRIS